MNEKEKTKTAESLDDFLSHVSQFANRVEEEAFIATIGREHTDEGLPLRAGERVRRVRAAWEAAITSFVLFAIGAIIPVFPYMYTSGMTAVGLSALFSAAGLFVIGASITLFTGRPVWQSGLRQVVFGLAAAAVTFLIGKLIGVNVAG